MITIDGETFDVPVVSLRRRADFLDKFAERTQDGNLHRELIGVYFNYELEFGSTTDVAEYARLWDKLTEPEEFHTVVVPDEDGDHTFTAYFSGVEDEMRRQKAAQNFWRDLRVHFIARSPARS